VGGNLRRCKKEGSKTAESVGGIALKTSLLGQVNEGLTSQPDRLCKKTAHYSRLKGQARKTDTTVAGWGLVLEKHQGQTRSRNRGDLGTVTTSDFKESRSKGADSRPWKTLEKRGGGRREFERTKE